MSANRINIGKEAFSLDYDDAKGAYSKVRIIIDERAEPYEYGTDEGRTFEIKNPWIEYPPNAGETRESGKPYADTIAADILSRLNGYEYQPFDAHGAFLPDNTELGDAVVVGGVYGAIVSQDIAFDGLGNSDVSAPNGEDNENEFGDYVPSADNSVYEQMARMRTEFTVKYGEITASVTDLDNEMGQTLRIAADGVTITNAQGSVLEIDGGQLKANSVTADEIDVSTLKVGSGGITVDGGAISWSNLDSATQGSITDAVVDASAAKTAAQTAENTVAGWTYTGSTYIDGSQIMTGTVTASTLQAGQVALLDYYGTVRGNFDLTATESGVGVAVNSGTGLKLNATTNVFINAGSGGALTLRDNYLTLTNAGINLSSVSFGTNPPSGTGNYGELYFQIVS